ncbi:hypothetical protein CHCC14820_1312 [Bacillus paralicheniformis]|nr:hypothetical protein CHCC14820_1312 [Bacillus paralicheniformis]
MFLKKMEKLYLSIIGLFRFYCNHKTKDDQMKRHESVQCRTHANQTVS